MGQGAEPRRPRLRDEELGAAVARAQEGDEAAFAAAYRMVHPGLVGYLRGLVGDRAEGVAADAWREIAADLEQFRGDGARFRGWTATVARRHALALPGPAGVSGPRARAGQEPASSSTARALELIGELPCEQREAVLLRAVVGLDDPAAARVLGTAPEAVSAAAREGLRWLARQLGTQAPEGGAGEGGPDGPGERGMAG
ncbi:RNA polymerase sigma factor [Streptomyces sp. NPDC049813]|uniref:RNA polymerase sigma factor n=1 Tax=Streptomyces sp. NPDC049813 TaxID=3365597 RepID=UPI003798C449